MTYATATVALVLFLASVYLNLFVSFPALEKARRRANTESGRLEKKHDIMEAKVAIVIATFAMILAFILAVYTFINQ